MSELTESVSGKVKMPALRLCVLDTERLRTQNGLETVAAKPKITSLFNIGHNCYFKILVRLKVAVHGD